MNHLRLFSYTEAAFEKAYQNFIIRVMAALGIKEKPNQVANEFIVYAFKHKFRQLTFQEIELAFNLNATGEWPTIDHYQQLNIEFIGKVLAQYLKLRQPVIEAIPKQLPPSEAISTEQRAANNKKLLEDICKAYDASKVNPSFEAPMSFLYLQELTERGIIPDGWNEDESYFQRAKEMRIAYLKSYTPDMRDVPMVRDALKAYEEGKFFKGEKAEIILIAKTLVLRHYFAKWHNESLDLRTWLIA